MWQRRQVLLGLAAACLTPALAQTEGPRLSIQGSAHQGMPLFVSLLDSSESAPEVSWENRRYPMAEVSSGVWRTVVPVGIDTRGTQILRVGSLERAVPVKARNYGMQYLSLNPATLASYDNPRNKADDKAILASMEEFDPKMRWGSGFQIPVEAPETTGFGQRRLYNGWKKGWHKGLDLGGWEGQQIVAPAAGKVVHRARGIVNGNTLVLSHGLGLFTVYLHLYSDSVEWGEEVQAGEAIAAVGGTGGFAPHLHWEARVFGVPVHPKAFFQLPAGWG